MEKILDRKLTVLEQKEILYDLFGFMVESNGVIYDEDGHEFHGYRINDNFDLSTIRGIIKYQISISTYSAISEHNNKIKDLLDMK